MADQVFTRLLSGAFDPETMVAAFNFADGEGNVTVVKVAASAFQDMLLNLYGLSAESKRVRREILPGQRGFLLPAAMTTGKLDDGWLGVEYTFPNGYSLNLQLPVASLPAFESAVRKLKELAAQGTAKS